MATEYNNPKMVMDNLVLYLDAANTKSYPGSGTWNDISGKGHTATINGATYNSCLLYTSPSPRDGLLSRMPSSA